MAFERSLLLHLLRTVAVLGVLIGVLFASAGRWDLPFVWAYAGVNIVLAIAGVFTIDPELQQERWRPAVGGKTLRPLLFSVLPCYLAHLVVAGLDVGRFHWSDNIPPGAQVGGLVMLTIFWGVTLWAATVNRFFSPVVRIQTERGHHLVATGPYRYVRHPGYASAIIGFVCVPLALGSWWAFAPLTPVILAVIGRTALEDRFLHKELPGYAEYAQRVRYRLVPGLW